MSSFVQTTLRDSRLLAALLAIVWLGAIAVPNWRVVKETPQAKDYATYHYAVKIADQGGDPYRTAELSALSREEGTRTSVHPYFYPPPFLIGLQWAVPLQLETAYRAWFWVNSACLGGLLLVLRRWFGAPVLLLGGIALTLNPIADNLRMGQANLPVLLLTVLALWRRNGVLLGAAGMAKMSPALYLVWWALRGWWRPALVAALTAVLLSVLALPVVDLPTQLRFYREVLPTFASGAYNGLTVPITLPANHSIPDLLNQLWPGPDKHHLAAPVQTATTVLTLFVVGGLSLLGRQRRDTLGDACLASALSVGFLVMPVYTYEHHLSLMVLPAAAVGSAWLSGRFGRGAPRIAWLVALGVAYGLVAVPLRWLRDVQDVTGRGTAFWLIQECKFVAVVIIGTGGLVAALRSPSPVEGLADVPLPTPPLPGN
jgi:Glycosyltransferase family 87